MSNSCSVPVIIKNWKSLEKLPKMCEKDPRNERFKPFPHPFTVSQFNNRDCDYPLTLMEVSMIEMSSKIRSKKDWDKKYKNPEIVEKWRKEAEDDDYSEAQIKYVLDQLEFYEIIKKDNMEAAFNHEVWQSWDLIPSDLRDEFLKCLSKLEQSLPEKDWHPGSDEKVLNLIHPSLYCCVYNRSKRVVMKNGIPEAELAKPPFGNCDLLCASEEYQWLPSEFSVEADGSVNIKSYINNLHPDHEDMYKTIGKIFEKFVPLFNEALTSYNIHLPRPVPDQINWYDDIDSNPEIKCDYFDRHEHIKIEPSPFKMPNLEAYLNKDMLIDLKDSNLQVIVKISSIELTPEKPMYEGGVWHVEGMLNESIIATGIYYYATENITESELLFRQSVCEPSHEQDDYIGVETVYGLINDEPMSQYIGNVVAEEGKCIVFPNVYQHKVAPFELVDDTKPGTRKILVFFLIDPSRRTISTADVLPQQKNWLESTVNAFKLFPNVNSADLKDLVCTMTLEEAKDYRLKLMEERKAYTTNEDCQFVRRFSCCEH